ncbi:hypothetical protein ACFLTJ_01890 [Chloroflexota bacterium]
MTNVRTKPSKSANEWNTTRTIANRLQNKPQQATRRVKGLTVGRNWKVGADSLNIILYQRHVNKKTDREYWRAHSYYSTVTNALVGLVNQDIRDTELADLKTVCDKIDELRRDILKVCGSNEGEKAFPACIQTKE